MDSFQKVYQDKELSYVYIMMHLNAVGYLLIGLVFNEPSIVNKYGLKKIIDFFTKEKFVDPAEEEAKKLEKRGTRTSKGLTRISDEYSTLNEELLASIRDDNLKSLEQGLDTHISIQQYQELVQNVDHKDQNFVLVAKGLTKAYPCSQGVKRALTNFSIKIEKGKIFGLLGPNGAGKTTFLSCVTGSVMQDKGQAWICGNDTQNRSLHAGNIGFCPQFDILWPQLNVFEHLKFMAMFKGMDEKEVDQSVHELIKEVDLEKDYKKLAVELSGGMKRRCSLAMSLTANPKIVFLDEPSSGLDPVKRRHFWSLVKKVTQEKAVLLTTHLMEEADTLCSEIAIVTTGKMRCVGNSLYLKKTFTEGIKIQIVLNPDICTTGQFMQRVKRKLKGVKLHAEFQGTLTLTVKDEAGSLSSSPSRRMSAIPEQESEATSNSEHALNNDDSDEEINEGPNSNYDQESGNKLSSLFQTMQEFIRPKDQNEQAVVNDWSISLGSLEDVFLNVVRQYKESNIDKRK